MGTDLLGYSFCGVGFLSLLCSFDNVNSLLVKYLPFISKFPDLAFQIFGAVLILLGVFLISGKSKKTKTLVEVPIYQGNQVVGYRRQK